MWALGEAKQAGLLQPRYWLNNIISGVIVGVVALPLAMAFAIASGAKPEQGLYTAIVAGFLVSVFGGSRLQIAGPTGAFIVILSGITAQYGIEGLQLATLMAGVMLFGLGLARMGGVIKFIPDPVIVGFTSGIAVIIWVGQWKDFFGLPAVTGTHFHTKLIHLIQVLPEAHWMTTLLAMISLCVVIYGPKLPGCQRIPGPLLALIVGTALQTIFKFQGIQTIGTAFGGIPQGLPHFAWPELSWSKVMELIGPAFTIAMLGAIESLLSAVVADGMAGTKHDSNQELMGQGIANIVAPLLGGFAATGAIARTATNIRNGGNSPLAGIVHSVTLVIILLVLAPFAIYIPLAVLAAILFVVAWNMSEVKHFMKMLKQAPRADVVILLITFLLTILTDLVIAVNIGVILAILYFLRKMAESVQVKPISPDEFIQECAKNGVECLPSGVLVFMIEGPFFFAAVEHFDRAISNTHTDPRVLIIRLKWVPWIDMTGLQTLEEVILDFQKRGVKVMLSGAVPEVDRQLRKSGLVGLIGQDCYFKTFEEALKVL